MDSSAVAIVLGDGLEQERRRSPRQTFICKALLLRDDRAAAPQRIMLRDISMHGVGFEASGAVEPGIRCRIRIEAGPVLLSLHVKIVCCGKIQEDVYRVGAELVKNELQFDEG